jgi:DNA-binding IclR family transcriptional regulator
LGVLDDGKVLYIRVMESPQVFRLAGHAGMRSPVHSTALGKRLLSRLPPAQVDEILKRHSMRSFTPKTLRDQASLHRELIRVRHQGYALDDEEDSPGIRCLAAPILDPAGNASGAMSISAPTVRLRPEMDREVAAALKEVCGHLSTLQGYTWRASDPRSRQALTVSGRAARTMNPRQRRVLLYWLGRSLAAPPDG